MMMKAAIFDLDGTLIDSMGMWHKIDIDFLTGRDILVPDDISTIVKNMSFTQAASYFKETFSLADTCEELMQIWNDMAYLEYVNNIKLKKGVREYLAKLSQGGVKLGVATASDLILVEAVLSQHSINSLFHTVVTVNDVGKGKENPEIYLLAAKKMGVCPEECVVFEDSLHAVMGAKRAGMKVFGVFDTFSAHERKDIERQADGYISSFDELLKPW